MKVAFILPHPFEWFFHDVYDIWNNADKIEDEIISKRDTWHFNWCKAMQLAGMDVTMYHLSMNGKSVREYYHKDEIKTKRLPTTFRFGNTIGEEFSYSLLTELKKDKPDIVFSGTHFLTPFVDMYDILVIFCKINKIPIITRNPGADTYNLIFHRFKTLLALYKTGKKRKEKKNGNDLYLLFKIIYKGIRSYIKFFFKKFFLKYSDIIITQTSIDYSNLINKFTVDKDKIYLLPKPIDLTHFYEMPKEVAAVKLGLNPADSYLLHVSNLYNTKGCQHIINIMPALISDFPNLKLVIIGGGPKKKELEELAMEKKITSYIRFEGQIDHPLLVYYYNLADALVLPTELLDNEGQPNVIMEAIACNTTPISTNIPGPAEIIGNGLGLVIEVGNKKELSDSIRRVLKGEYSINPDKRAEFLKEYSLENVGNHLKKIFSQVIIK